MCVPKLRRVLYIIMYYLYHYYVHVYYYCDRVEGQEKERGKDINLRINIIYIYTWDAR